MNAEHFMRANGQRPIKLRCTLCDKLLVGPLSRFLMDYAGKELELMCPACRQTFTVETKNVKYEA